jgi:SET domain-containing protein
MYGNKARFINHSHNKQNISPMKIRIQEEDVILFYALRDIHEHEELFFNYNGQGSLSEFRDKYPFID